MRKSEHKDALAIKCMLLIAVDSALLMFFLFNNPLFGSKPSEILTRHASLQAEARAEDPEPVVLARRSAITRLKDPTLGTQPTGPPPESFTSLGTSYGIDPSQYESEAEAALEGGPSNRFSEAARAVDGIPAKGIKGQNTDGTLVTLAMDYTGDWGKRANRPDRRALLAVHVPNIWSKVDGLEQRLTGIVPRDYIIGVVEDTGDAFIGKQKEKVDIAFTDIEIARTMSNEVDVYILGFIDTRQRAYLTVDKVAEDPRFEALKRLPRS